MTKRWLIAGALALGLSGGAPAQSYRDSAGTTVQGVATAGSTGRDFSANPASLPVVGSAFGSSGTYANYVLIAVVPASSTRLSIDVENNSGAQIAVVLDDGTSAIGAAPTNATAFSLAGGAGVGSQGGSWVSAVEKGRVQIYSSSASAQVAIRQN